TTWIPTLRSPFEASHYPETDDECISWSRKSSRGEVGYSLDERRSCNKTRMTPTENHGAVEHNTIGQSKKKHVSTMACPTTRKLSSSMNHGEAKRCCVARVRS
ncbi:hypothetical protein JAAARDRAFT_35541, partial [Jaapia argillacea MUCL 33604]